MMRPDEQANQAQIGRDQRVRKNIGRGIETAATIGVGTALAATGAASKVLPWLNKYIPADLAMKGLRKVAPKVASFLDRGQSMGLDIKEGMDFVKDKLSSNQEEISPETPKNVKEHRNIIEQYSPELFQFIDQEVKKGRTIWTASGEAFKNPKFQSVIKKMIKDHKVPWTAIVETAFGNFRSGQQSQQENMPQENTLQQGQQNQGGIDPQLQSIIQQGNEIIKRFRGQ